MIKREAGFTLIELLITMVIFVIAIAAASGIFTSLLTQFKQQSKIAETNIEGIVGLEILRQDIEHAGYGLPWVYPVSITCAVFNNCEAANAPASNFNDTTPNPVNPPRAIISGNNVIFFGGGNAIFNGTDYLVIKSTNVGNNDTSRKWTTLQVAPFTPLYDPVTGYNPRVWDIAGERFVSGDNVIVLTMGATPTTERRLVVDGAVFSTTYGNITTAPWPPTDNTEKRTVYGVDPDTALRMPFNRADYYILKFDGAGTDIVPTRCAPNTGVLRKAAVNQGAGTFAGGTLPLLDCVADLQVVYRRDTNGDGTIDNTTDDISALTAQQIREQVKEVRVYILAHEGQRDVNYTYPTNPVALPAAPDPGFGSGSSFNFNTHGITNWQNYRWKVYTLVVKPNNLE